MADYRPHIDDEFRGHNRDVRDVSNHLRVARGWSGGTQDTPGKSTSGRPA